YFLLFLFHNLLSLFLGFLFYSLYQFVLQPFLIISHFLILLFLYQFHILYILFSLFLLLCFFYRFHFPLLNHSFLFQSNQMCFFHLFLPFQLFFHQYIWLKIYLFLYLFYYFLC